jgi:hypothetical protein
MIYLLAMLQGASAVAALHPSPPPATIVALQPSGSTGVVIGPAPMMQPPLAPRSVPVVVEPNAVAPIRVHVVADNRTLFDDELKVGRSSGASYNESRSEAANIDCSADRYYGGGDRSSLSVQLYLRDEVQTGPAVNLSITWQRPASTGVCPNEGTRSVSLTQTVPLAPGQSATLRGDGGLVVTLSRR